MGARCSRQAIPLLEPLRTVPTSHGPSWMQGVCWPNGLELSAPRYSSNVGFCRGFDEGQGERVLHLLIACPFGVA